MKHLKMNLQLFAGSLTLTTYKDAGYTTCNASASSSLGEEDEVTYTIVMASGYEYADCEIIAGGATYNPETKKLTMGDANAVVYFKSKANATYKVTENCYCNVNGTVTNLKRNMVLVKGANGEITDVTCTGTDLSSLNANVISQLVAAGVLVKI